MVFLDRRPENLDADCVIIDNHGAALSATEKLIREGHTRIAALVDTLNMETMRQRLNGVRQACRNGGVTLDESLIALDVAQPEQARQLVEEMLGRADPPTAFVCGNNRSAIGAITALWDLPRNKGIVSFDDFNLAELMPQPFTVVKYDYRAIGVLGADLLFRRINGEVFEPQTVVLPSALCERGVRCA